MALNQPGDLELLPGALRRTAIGVVAVLYKYPLNLKGLQFMAESSRLGLDLGGFSYRVLAGTIAMHVENGKLPGVQLLTKDMAISVPLVVRDFAGALTNGDSKSLFDQLDVIQSEIHPSYGITP